MPVIDLFHPEGALSQEARDEAMARLTSALLRHEGAPENEQTLAMSRGFVHELPPTAMYVGGEPADRPTYRVMMTVPAGALLSGPGPMASSSRRALVREATEILLEAEGTPFDDVEAGRVFCLIVEVPDGHWGGMGAVFRIEDVVALASPEWPDQTPLAARARRALAEFASRTPA